MSCCPFLSPHTLPLANFLPPWFFACMENGQDWVNGERAPQRVMGRDCRASICSHHFLLFPLTWKIESLTWGEKKKFNFVMGCRCNKNAGTTAEAGATHCDDSCSCMSYQFSLIFCTLFHQGIMNAAVPRILCAHLTHEFSFVSGKNDFVKGR